MTARCTVCSDWKNFRASRGNKLIDNPCRCGGAIELMFFEPELSITTARHIYRNKKKELFEYIRDAVSIRFVRYNPNEPVAVPLPGRVSERMTAPVK